MAATAEALEERDGARDLVFFPCLHTGSGGDRLPAPAAPGWQTMAARLLQPTFLVVPPTAMAAPTPYSTGGACEYSDTD